TCVAEARIRRRAHSRRIAQANICSCGGQIEIQPVPVSQEPAHVQLTTPGLGSKLLNPNAVLSEYQGAVDVAETIGQIEQRNAGVHEVHFSSDLWMLERAVNVNGKVGRPVGDDVRVVALKQSQVHATFCAQVEPMIARKPYPALHISVSVISYQMELIHVSIFAVHGQVHWTVIVQPDVLQVRGQLVSHTADDQVARMPEWPMNVNSPRNGGVTGDLSVKVSSDQRVEIKVCKVELHLPGPVAAQPDLAIHVQGRALKARAPLQHHIGIMGFRCDPHCAHVLSVQHQISQVQLSIQHRCIFPARTHQMKRGLALHGQPGQFKEVHRGQINVFASEIEFGILRGKVMREIARQSRAIVTKKYVPKLNGVRRNLDLAAKSAERLPRNSQLVDLHAPRAMGRLRSTHYVQIRRQNPGHRLLEPEQRLEFLHGSGILATDLHIMGTPESPHGAGSVQINKLTVSGEPFRAFRSQVQIAANTIQLRNIFLSHNGARLTGDFSHNFAAQYSEFDLTGENIDLASMHLFELPRLTMAGKAAFHLVGSGREDAPV